MQTRASVLLLALGLLALAASGTGAPPGPPQTRAFTLHVVEIPCDGEPDGICLAYNGAIPGPTLDVNLGDTIEITLVNDHARAVSWHVHGTALAADMDGIAAHPGTQLVESVAPPGGSFTYTVRAAFAGAWHYHDHVLGADGSEGVRRGLYGSLVVRSGAEARADHVLDLHMLDTGPNGGRGAHANVTSGASFEVVVVGLGDLVWPVRLLDPSGALIDSTSVGPGMSDRFRVDAAAPGTYTLRSATGIVGLIGATP